MEKIYILVLLTTSLYACPYSYGASVAYSSPVHLAISPELCSATNTLVTALMPILKLIQEGDKYYDKNDYNTAITYYKQAMQEYLQKNNNTVLILAQIFNNIGMCYLDMKAYQFTFVYYNNALIIRQLALEEAKLSYYDQSICKSISEHVGKSHHNLGLFYLDIHKPKKAINSFKAALKTEWQHHVEATDTEYFLAWAYMQEKCYKESKILYKNILAKQKKKAYLTDEEIQNVEKNLQQIAEKMPPHQASKQSSSIANKAPLSHSAKDFHHPVQVKKEATIATLCAKKDKKEIEEHPLTYTKYPPFFCRQCNLSFFSKNYYTKHMQSHRGEKNFTCPICHKRFPLQSKMQIHMRLHIGEKPFQCTFCYRNFANKDKMQKHIITMHKNPIPIPY